jgi:predicted dehydrogenase
MGDDKQTFSSQAGAQAVGEAPEIGVAVLGYAFMGKAHTNAFKKLPYMMYPPVAVPRLEVIGGTNKAACEEAARRFGYKSSSDNWKRMLDDHAGAVQLFDNCGPNNIHADPSIHALELGMNVLCEKPIARTADEAARMVEAARKAKGRAMVAFNYRFVPAVRQIRYLIESGALGRIYHWRAVYLQEWIMPHYGTPAIWRLSKDVAGSGAIGDLGAHIIDLAHFLVGDIRTLSARQTTFIPERPDPATGRMVKVDVDDAFVAICEFANGALGTFEATRFAGGRKNYNCFEINGERASIRFNLERMNEFEIFWIEPKPRETEGWTSVLVTEGFHPWISNWWPHGHIIGWEHTFVHEINHLLDCIVNGKEVGPYGATFEDGYKAAVICDAIVESSDRNAQVDITYKY